MIKTQHHPCRSSTRPLTPLAPPHIARRRREDALRALLTESIFTMSEPSTIKNICDLKMFHCVLVDQHILCSRIPGGFIFTLYFPDRTTDTTSVYVPITDIAADPLPADIP